MPAFRKDAIEIIPAVGNAEQLRTELLVIGVFGDRSLTGSPKRIDDLAGGKLSSALAQHGLGASVGATILIEGLPGTAAARLLIVNLGHADDFSGSAYQQALTIAGRCLAQSGVQEAVVALPDASVDDKPLHWHVRQAGQALADGGRHSSDPDQAQAGPEVSRPQRIMLLIPQTLTSELVTALRQGVAVAGAIDIARRLADLPRETCTAAHIARAAMTIGDELGLSVEMLHHGEVAPHETGDGSLIAAAEAPGLIVMSSRRGRKARPIVLLGEGHPHRPAPDGTPAKTGTGAGIGPASAILGAMWMAGRLGLPLNLVALIPAAAIDEVTAAHKTGTAEGEDRAAGAASREIVAYARRLVPDCLIDVAGLEAADDDASVPATDCLYANDRALAAELVGCGARAGEPVRHLAFEAAMPGDGTSAPGPTLHCRSRYAGPYRWAHLEVPDLAAGRTGSRPAKGHPVPLLAEFLIGRAHPRPDATMFIGTPPQGQLS